MIAYIHPAMLALDVCEIACCNIDDMRDANGFGVCEETANVAYALVEILGVMCMALTVALGLRR